VAILEGPGVHEGNRDNAEVSLVSTLVNPAADSRYYLIEPHEELMLRQITYSASVLTAALLLTLAASPAHAIEPMVVDFADSAAPRLIIDGSSDEEVALSLIMVLADTEGETVVENPVCVVVESPNPHLSKLLCPGFGQAPVAIANPYDDEPVYELILNEFNLASTLVGYTPVDGTVDEPLTNAIKVARRSRLPWFEFDNYVECVLEESDTDLCLQTCSQLGAVTYNISASANPVTEQCDAVCECIQANGSKTNHVVAQAPI
jgi:hypothetical protein